MRRFAGPPGLSARCLAVLAVLALAAVGLGACSPSGRVSDARSSAAGCSAFERYGTPDLEGLEGTVVTVSSALSPREVERLEASLATFEECTGIDVVHTSTGAMEADLLAAAAAAAGTPGAQDTGAPASGRDLPDLAIVPQPGLVAELARAGVLTPLPREVNANTEIGWNREWAQLGTYDDTPYAAPLMASVKSFVWFSPAAFQDSGYSVPRTWAELEALTRQVVKDHPDGSVTPWCLGLADGESTGWVMTDWLEDAMLATQGPGAYDAWAGHEVPLDHASAVRALETVDSLVLAEGRVEGGREAAVTRSVEGAGTDLVEGRCLMLHASSSFESMLPEGTAVTDVEGRNAALSSASASGEASGGQEPSAGDGEDGGSPAGSTHGSAEATPTGAPARTDGTVSAFLLPSGDRGGEPVLVGADYLVATSDGEAPAAVMQYLTSADWARERVSLGGVATAHQAVDASQIPSDVARRATTVLQSRETTVRMDASDSMPAEVGTGTLWADLTRWTGGGLAPAEALAQAERRWPQGR